MGIDDLLKVFVFILIFVGGAISSKAEVPQNAPQIKLSFAPIVRKAHGAVVNIYAHKHVVRRRGLRHRYFGENLSNRLGLSKKRIESILGSGVVLSADGLVVTNLHVIKGLHDKEVTVVFPDKSEYQVHIKLKDKRTDLAILQIISQRDNFPFLSMGDSSKLAVGDLVLAIGNPFGVGQSVSSGIVSALGRNSFGESDYQTFIQTDAAINPGNSGGALVDMKGELIGVNTSIYSRSGGSDGIGFAVPSQLVKTVLKSAKLGTRVRRPWFGAKLKSVNKAIVHSLGLNKNQGVLVTNVLAQGPAQSAGLSAGDVITHLNKKPVNDLRNFKYSYSILGIGGQAEVSVIKEGKTASLVIDLIEAPMIPKPDEVLLKGETPLQGAIIANLSPALAVNYSFTQTGGIVILKVHSHSYAASIGLARGDILVKLNGVKLTNTRHLESLSSRRRHRWELDVKRKGRVIRLVLPG